MKNKKGFTLIELMAVITVMGIVALIAVPIYNNTSKKVKEKQYENVVTAIEVASEKYAEKTAKIRFSVQELIDRGEYEADNEKGEVLSPIDKKVLNCHIVNVDYENENYEATFTDEDDCNVAAGLKEMFGIKLQAKDESGVTWTNSEAKWTRYNVELTATINETGLPEELKGKEYTATYDWFAGNVKVNNEGNSNKYNVEAQTILNVIYQVRVTLHTEEKDYTSASSIKVQIDKQKPLIYEVSIDKENEWIEVGNTKEVEIKADDYNGSGIKGYYIGTGTCPTTEGSYKEEYNKAQTNGNYIACVMDNVGNISEAKGFKIEKIDSALPTVRFVDDGTGSGNMHKTAFTLKLESNLAGYQGSPITYYYGTNRNNVETPYPTSGIKIAPPAKTQTYYGKICNATTCSDIVEYTAILDEEPPAPIITASDGVKSYEWHKSPYSLSFEIDRTIYHGSPITYYYRVQKPGSSSITSNTALENEKVSISSYGQRLYYVKACNQSGLCSREELYSSHLDCEPTIPEITANDGLPSGSWHAKEFSLHFHSISYTPVTYYYGTSPSNMTKMGNDITFTKEQINQLVYVKACNQSGLCSKNSVYLVNGDKEAPLIDIKLSTYEWTTNPITMTIQIKDDISGISKWCLEDIDAITENCFNITDSSKQASKDITVKTYKNYKITAIDVAGNKKVYYYTVNNVDAEGPRITLTDWYMYCGTDNYYDWSFQFTYYDEYGGINEESESKLRYQVRDISKGRPSENDSYWHTMNFSYSKRNALTIGPTYCIYVKAYDASGNYSIRCIKKFSFSRSYCTYIEPELGGNSGTQTKTPICIPQPTTQYPGICIDNVDSVCQMYAYSIAWHLTNDETKKACYVREAKEVATKKGWKIEFYPGSGQWKSSDKGAELYSGMCGFKTIQNVLKEDDFYDLDLPSLAGCSNPY